MGGITPTRSGTRLLTLHVAAGGLYLKEPAIMVDWCCIAPLTMRTAESGFSRPEGALPRTLREAHERRSSAAHTATSVTGSTKSNIVSQTQSGSSVLPQPNTIAVTRRFTPNSYCNRLTSIST